MVTTTTNTTNRRDQATRGGDPSSHAIPLSHRHAMGVSPPLPRSPRLRQNYSRRHRQLYYSKVYFLFVFSKGGPATPISHYLSRLLVLHARAPYARRGAVEPRARGGGRGEARPRAQNTRIARVASEPLLDIKVVVV